MGEGSDQQIIQFIRTSAESSLRRALAWLSEQQKGDNGWPSAQTRATDELSTAETLVYLESGKKRVQRTMSRLHYDYFGAISRIYDGLKTTSNGCYWERRSPDGAVAPSPYYTGKIVFDLTLLGEQPEKKEIQEALRWLGNSKSGSGWEFTLGEGIVSPIATANILLAYSLLGSIIRSESTRSIENEAVNLLERIQRNNGHKTGDHGWGGKLDDPPNLGATAVVVRALSELGLHQTASYLDAISYIKRSLSNDGHEHYYPDITQDRKHVRNTAWSVAALLLSGESITSQYVVSPVEWLIGMQESTTGAWSASGLQGDPTVRDTHDGIGCLVVYLKCLDYYREKSSTKPWRFSEAVK